MVSEGVSGRKKKIKMEEVNRSDPITANGSVKPKNKEKLTKSANGSVKPRNKEKLTKSVNGSVKPKQKYKT